VSRTAPKVVYAGSIFTPASPIQRATPPIVRAWILDIDDKRFAFVADLDSASL
jgi:hypothetical protein